MIELLPATDRIRRDGLRRCCIETIRRLTAAEPKPYDVLWCENEHCPNAMVYRDGAWERALNAAHIQWVEKDWRWIGSR